MKTSLTRQILDMASERGAIRGSDLDRIQAPSSLLRSMTRRGLLIRPVRGVYMLPNYPVTEHHTLVEVTIRHPRAIICLLSALQFHGIGTQLPHQVWIAIPKGDKEPVSDLPLRVHRFSREAYAFGVQVHAMEGVQVSITSKAKTIADCLKYRNKIGLDVALEALREFVQKRQPGDLQELHEAAKACRVERILKPYIEALL